MRRRILLGIVSIFVVAGCATHQGEAAGPTPAGPSATTFQTSSPPTSQPNDCEPPTGLLDPGEYTGTAGLFLREHIFYTNGLDLENGLELSFTFTMTVDAKGEHTGEVRLEMTTNTSPHTIVSSGKLTGRRGQVWLAVPIGRRMFKYAGTLAPLSCSYASGPLQVDPFLSRSVKGSDFNDPDVVRRFDVWAPVGIISVGRRTPECVDQPTIDWTPSSTVPVVASNVGDYDRKLQNDPLHVVRGAAGVTTSTHDETFDVAYNDLVESTHFNVHIHITLAFWSPGKPPPSRADENALNASMDVIMAHELKHASYALQAAYQAACIGFHHTEAEARILITKVWCDRLQRDLDLDVRDYANRSEQIKYYAPQGCPLH